MIKFFSRIRQNLLSENKFSKYLLYAIGEIVLVVIGILIALAINDEQQYIKDREVELNNLIKFNRDLTQDSVLIENLITREQRIIKDIDTLYTLLLTEDDANISQVFIKSQAIGSSSIFDVNSGTYDESISTGTMRTVLNDSLRSEIFSYYKLVKINQNDRITDEYQNSEIVPVLINSIATTKEAVRFITDVENPYLNSLSVKSLLQDPDFNKIIVWRKANGQILIDNWTNFLSKNANLNRLIRQEITLKKEK
jgi:hypothetical protein